MSRIHRINTFGLIFLKFRINTNNLIVRKKNLLTFLPFKTKQFACNKIALKKTIYLMKTIYQVPGISKIILPT